MPNVHVDALTGNSWLDVGENNIISYRLNNDFGEGAWTANEVAAYQAATQAWANVADLTFVRFYSGDADWVENKVDTATMIAQTGGNWGGWHNSPNAARNQPGYYNTDRPYFDDDGLAVGGFGFELMVHELGHGLGLAHTHNMGQGTTVFPGVTGPNDLGTYNLNETRFSIMSYNDQKANNTDDIGNVTGPMAFDIAAIQAMYGANTTYNNGDNTYFLTDNGNWSSIWDTGGTDTIRYDGANDVEINLNSARLDGGPNAGGYFSQVTSGAGVTGGYTIAGDYTNALANQGTETGVIIENARGGSGDDTLLGNGVANTLTGGAGDDILKGAGGNDTLYANTLQAGGGLSTEENSLFGGDGNDTLYGSDGDDNLYGGADDDILRGNGGNDTIAGDAGNDTVDYQYATAAVNVNLATGTASGGDGNDTLSDIENIYGSENYGDTLTGDSGANVIKGLGGDDTINGGLGADILLGGDGNDTINGGYGLDTMDGGDGIDTMDVSFYSGAYQWNMNTGDTNFAGETAENFENAITGSGADQIVGTDGANVITTNAGADVVKGLGGADTINSGSGNDIVDGGAGADTINGGSGNDTLFGGDGADNIAGGSGNDVLAGGEGNDTLAGDSGIDIVDYSAATAAINFTVGVGSFSAAGLGTDTLSGIEGVYGTDYNDTLTGNAANNILRGGDGDDILDGMGGTDTADYGDASAGVEIDLRIAGPQNTVGAGTDTLINIENVVGSNFADKLQGNNQTNQLDGAGGNDRLYGNTGVDTLNGGEGADLLIGDAGNDIMDGGTGNDRLYGGTSDDVLFGGDGADLLAGGPGVDRLDGGNGADRLYADGTADTFVFTDLAGAGDRIFNFVSGLHDIEIDASGFGGGAGGFAFVSNGAPVATTAQQALLYDTDDGKLYFYADGNGAGALVHVLTIVGAPALAATDILLV